MNQLIEVNKSEIFGIGVKLPRDSLKTSRFLYRFDAVSCGFFIDRFTNQQNIRLNVGYKSNFSVSSKYVMAEAYDERKPLLSMYYWDNLSYLYGKYISTNTTIYRRNFCFADSFYKVKLLTLLYHSRFPIVITNFG